MSYTRTDYQHDLTGAALEVERYIPQRQIEAETLARDVSALHLRIDRAIEAADFDLASRFNYLPDHLAALTELAADLTAFARAEFALTDGGLDYECTWRQSDGTV